MQTPPKLTLQPILWLFVKWPGPYLYWGTHTNLLPTHPPTPYSRVPELDRSFRQSCREACKLPRP